MMGLTVGLPMLGFSMWHVFEVWRFWPLTVVGVGLGFVLPPILVRGRRGLGGLFIAGAPILTTGCILLFCSILDWWDAWAWLWPLEVLAVATGFLLAALSMGVIWLIIPGFIVGANGLLFLFCAITGMWDVWALMWTIEPLSVGLALMVIGARKKRPGLMTAAIILCSIGGVSLFGMAAILSISWMAGWLWMARFVFPVMLVFGGIVLLLWSLTRKSAAFKVR